VKVAHVLQSSDGGGAAYVRALVRGLAGRGVESRIVAFDGAGAIERVAGPEWRRAASLARLAREVDLVHVHGTRAAASALPALVRGRSVVTLHGLHPLRRQRGPLYHAAGWALVAAVVAAADAVVCVSHGDAATLALLPVGRGKRHVIRNAVAPPEPLSPEQRERVRAELGLEPGELAVVYVGRLHDSKDPLLAVSAVRGAPGMRLLVAGDGPLRADVERHAAGWPNVSLLGWRGDVTRLVAAADVMLNTSRWEGLPLSVLEAMWLERPVVAARVSGNDEVLQLPELLVASRRPEAFRAALERLRDPAERARVAAVQRARVEREFRLDELLDRMEALYRRLAGSGA